ncbi:MAG: hypothetical protein HYU99_08335 [Deltaproteobacteria bacterium]|nr:hypothetical protein [Deltaproteobacteria bacterium]
MSHEELSDEEVVEFILESLEEDGRVRTDCLDIECVNGRPCLSGRVATDEERELIDEILTDVLNIHDYENTVWVDDRLTFEKVEDDEEGGARGRSSLEEDDHLETEEPLDEGDDGEDDKDS